MTRPAPGSNGGHPVEFDPALPITAHRDEIVAALERHSVIVVCGATGSGKSTQLPKLCLAAGRGAQGRIGHTQPRRIAARALASRLAQELGAAVGGLVGFKVRFDDRTGPDCRIQLMTDGILLREIASDPQLRRYDTLIIDEAHERSLNIDLILGVVKRLTARRPDLKVIVTSATLDPGKLARFFEGAPVIEVSGRSFPVEVRYRPLVGEDEDAAELSLPEGVVAAVRDLGEDPRTARGDVLVFLPGEKHIRETAEALSRARIPDTDVLPLFARLSSEDQARIFERHTRRRVVLATNVAETSLTVPGIRCVVDSGLVRLSRYSVRGKVQRLQIERISRASAEQRKGRCGREAEGVCVRLYSEDDFAGREEFTPPEILRTHLAGVILHMAASGLGEPERFPFLDPPDTRLVSDGVRLLQELDAMDAERRITRTGRQLAALPCDPRLGRMLVAAAPRRCLAEMLIITAFLAIQDPRERPAEAREEADARHASFADARSDFMTILALWRLFRAEAAARSRGELRKWCRSAFLSFVRMREWQDLHGQLTDAVAELGLAEPPRPAEPSPHAASYADIHRAALSGLLGSIGALGEKREYEGARGTRFVIAPGSPLAAKPPRWVAAASLAETTRLYARMAAAVEPAWIESAASHLVKRSYGEPHWSRSRGQVVAYETVSLYGLTLAARRRVNYGPLAPREAHEIFIREALVAGHGGLRAQFLEANRRQREQIEILEAKIRRRDILVDEQGEVDFYRARVPERVSSTAAFERWRIDAERRDPRLLHMGAADLMRRDAPESGPESFPDELEIAGNRLPLRYVFEPGEPGDGITLLVPAPLIDALDADRLAWLVPGLRHEKATALLRALPKAVRKLLVPVPEHARAALAELESARPPDAPACEPPQAGFFEWMAHWIARRTGAPVTPAQLAALELPPHLCLNVRVVDSAENETSGPTAQAVLAEGRNLSAIRETLRRARARPAAGGAPAGTQHRSWDFGELPEALHVRRGGLGYRVFPAIEDRGHAVERVEAPSGSEAEAVSRAGVRRLAVLALPQQAKDLRRRTAEDRELILLVQGLPLARPLPDAITDRAFTECFLPGGAELPRTRAMFEALLEARRGALYDAADRVTGVVRATLQAWRPVRAACERLRSYSAAMADVDAQLAALLPPDFIESTPEPWLTQLPRYMHAIARRLERLPGNERRDAELMGRVAPFVRAWQGLARQHVYASPAPAVQRLRWMVEELRVSLFAQGLKTLLPVSEKRLAGEYAALSAQTGPESAGCQPNRFSSI